nr:cold-regulated 47 [Tanacetum cinerariifolium]
DPSPGGNVLPAPSYYHYWAQMASNSWNGACYCQVSKLSRIPFCSWTVVSKAIEKGMQDGLAARIIHGREGRVLTDVAAHNPAAEADYVSALQQLYSVIFSLLAELKANKDASIKVVMNILRLEEHLAARFPCREDRENIMSHRTLFQDVFVPLAEPLSAMALTGMEDDYGVMGMDDQSAVNESVVDEDANPFLNVDDAELNIP